MKPSKFLVSVCWALVLLGGAASAKTEAKVALAKVAFNANSKSRATSKPVLPASKPVAYQLYSSYFESRASGLRGESSHLVLPTRKAFDQVFGAAALMGQNRFVPRDAFNSQVVVAVIKRGASIAKYAVQGVETRGGTLLVRYKTTVSNSVSQGTRFASPLILMVPKATYRSVVFIENGQRVADVGRIAGSKVPRIKVFLVAVGDGGKLGRKFGCDDSLVPVTRDLSSGRAPLRSALQCLLAMPRRDAKNAGLENFWTGRDLRLQSVSLRNGVATIHIAGEVFVAGVCDQPRITEQIEATARQFATVKQVKVFIGREPLSRAIS